MPATTLVKCSFSPLSSPFSVNHPPTYRKLLSPSFALYPADSRRSSSPVPSTAKSSKDTRFSSTMASQPSGPTWARAAPTLAAPIEDHTGSSGSGMDELLAPVSTLDEPVSETIMRDVRAVGGKLRAVMIPLDRSVSLHCASFRRR